MPPGIKFEQKVPPKKRVIATKLNLRQKCVFHLFYCFSSFFFVFRRFSLFFNVFHHFSTFSSFCFVFHRFSSSQIYFHSELKQLLQTSSAVISNIYSTNFCMLNPPFLAFWSWKTLPFQLLLLLEMKLVCCELISLCFEGHI